MIYRCGLPIATGRIRNATSRGLFVETRNCELAEHQRLQFELSVAGEGSIALQPVCGVVVHIGAEGIGIRLDETAVATVDRMINLIRRNMKTAGHWWNR